MFGIAMGFWSIDDFRLENVLLFIAWVLLMIYIITQVGFF